LVCLGASDTHHPASLQTPSGRPHGLVCLGRASRSPSWGHGVIPSTGGVALFGMQIAKASGARVIVCGQPEYEGRAKDEAFMTLLWLMASLGTTTRSSRARRFV
jgi:hypothetical protein